MGSGTEDSVVLGYDRESARNGRERAGQGARPEAGAALRLQPWLAACVFPAGTFSVLSQILHGVNPKVV